MKKSKIFLFSFLAFIACLNILASIAIAEEREYFQKLARETYNSICFLIEDRTGLPYDSSRFNRPDTSVSNIGMYLASLVGACELGIEPADRAIEKARRTLTSLEKFSTWNGFTSCWNNVLELTPSTQDPWVSVLDTGNLTAGLILVAEKFDSLSSQANSLLHQIQWQAVYRAEKGLLYGGYELKKQELSKKWLLCHLGSDARFAYVVAIGQGHIPADSWKNLSRQEEIKYGLKYLVPGWQGGGIFMQFLSGLFLDETGSLMGRSAASMAFAQMLHAKVINAPVWGWSACELPDGKYMGNNNIADDFVSPYASALTLDYFPDAVMENFHQLEKMGARQSFRYDGQEYAFGFHDSINIRTGEINPHFLFFDQSMFFLSLVNHLTNGKLKQLLRQHPVISSGLEQIADYQISPQARKDFYLQLTQLGANQIIMQTGPVSMQQDGAGNRILTKDIHLINFTPHDYNNFRLCWKIMRDDTDEVLNTGDKPISLKNRTSLNSASAWFKVPPLEDANSVFYLEAKLIDEQGQVVSKYIDIFPTPQ